MHPKRRAMMWTILVGGTAVLASYGHAVLTNPVAFAAAWGGVSPEIRPVYGASMLLAMLGYFAFTHFLFFRVDPDQAQIANRFSFSVFNILFVAILVPSALWTPLTLVMVQRPGSGLWLAIRFVLTIVGLASLGLIGALLTLQPRRPVWAYRLAVLGSLAFSIQTALLDALIWPALFPF